MKSRLCIVFISTVLFFFDAPFVSSQESSKIDLSSNLWNITLDEKAEWRNDKLFLPPVIINKLPVNIPTGSWELLETPDKKGITLRATVEGYLWNRRGDSFGVNGNYTGVSWFITIYNLLPDITNHCFLP